HPTLVRAAVLPNLLCQCIIIPTSSWPWAHLLFSLRARKGEYEERVKGVIDVKKASPQLFYLSMNSTFDLISVGKGQGNQAGMDAANLLKPELYRLPDSAFDLMDEACASARVQQDLKPETIEELEQGMVQQVHYIRSLERDNHPGDDNALNEAKQAMQQLQAKLSFLEHEQSAVTEWWKLIVSYCDGIQKKRLELNTARSLVRMEQKGQVQKGLGDQRNSKIMDHQFVSLLAKNWHTVSSLDTITPKSIVVIVEKVMKIPVRQLLDMDKERLLHLQSTLEKKVIGKPEVINAISGTGKTLLSKALAEELFGQSTAMICIDGSEYSQSHSILQLVNIPLRGVDDAGMHADVRRLVPLQDMWVMIKADSLQRSRKLAEFLTLFLQVMDDGRLTDGQGQLMDFCNTAIIMTSNVGADILSKESGKISDHIRQAVITLTFDW
ncbi:P-loop containing nucleoside triphosphate hydrolase protein, partial [Suillus hirtellus]